jgi:hypothetical protein
LATLVGRGSKFTNLRIFEDFDASLFSIARLPLSSLSGQRGIVPQPLHAIAEEMIE